MKYLLWFVKMLVLFPVLPIIGLTQSDRVYAAINATETTEAVVGTISIPTAGVRRIIGVWGKLMQPVATAGEQVSGYFKLSFTTISGKFKFPVTVQLGPAGTLADSGKSFPTPIIPVDIPVPPNETVTCSMAADVALTGAGTGEIGLIME